MAEIKHLYKWDDLDILNTDSQTLLEMVLKERNYAQTPIFEPNF